MRDGEGEKDEGGDREFSALNARGDRISSVKDWEKFSHR